MNYTAHGHLIAIAISGAIVLSLNWLILSLGRNDPPQPTSLKAMKIVAIIALSIPVVLSPALFLIIPGMSSYYFLELMIGLVFAISFLAFEYIATRVSAIFSLIDSLASKLIYAFICISMKVYEPLISGQSSGIRSRYISMLIRYDVNNRCTKLVNRELDSLDLSAKARALQYGYVDYLTVPDNEDDLEYYYALNEESQRQQEHLKRLPASLFLASLFAPTDLSDSEMIRVQL